MLLALLAAATSQPVAEVPGRSASQTPARASVRILRAAVIRVDRFEATDGSVKRVTSVRERDGTLRSASLIEFY